MFGALRGKGREKAGVLAARLAVPDAQHPRVVGPTAGSVLASLGSLDVATVGGDATVFDALRIMAERDTAAVAVVSSAGLVGIFSERDHARNSLQHSRAAKDTPVSDVIIGVVARVAPTESVRRCLDELAEQRVTHAAVLDHGRLIGLLARTDLLAAQIAYHERIFHEAEVDQKLLYLRGTYSC